LLKSGTAKAEDDREIGSSFGIGDDQGGGASDENIEELKPKIDLPVYRTNDSRRRIQGLAFSAREVIYSLDEKVSGPKETVRTNIVALLDKLMVDANVGLNNLAVEKKAVKDMSEEEKEEAVKSLADRMGELYTKSAKKLQANFGGGQAADPLGG
jgi:hypothetical protein